jgi:hypothetical protein
MIRIHELYVRNKSQLNENSIEEYRTWGNVFFITGEGDIPLSITKNESSDYIGLIIMEDGLTRKDSENKILLAESEVYLNRDESVEFYYALNDVGFITETKTKTLEEKYNSIIQMAI